MKDFLIFKFSSSQANLSPTSTVRDYESEIVPPFQKKQAELLGGIEPVRIPLGSSLLANIRPCHSASNGLDHLADLVT